jgi:hypothetical protein
LLVAFPSSQEPLDLQIDYWLSPGSTRSSTGAIERIGDRPVSDRGEGRAPAISRGDSVASGGISLIGDGERGGADKGSKGSGKCSLRAGFRSLVIQRRPALGETTSTHHFTMTYSLKEKKQKSKLVLSPLSLYFTASSFNS